MSESRWGKILVRLAVSATVTIVLLWLLLRETGLQTHDLKLREVRPGFLLLALGAYLAVNVVRAMRFAVIHRELGHVPFRRFLEVALVHSGLNQILPFRTGEVSYVYLMGKVKGGSFGRSLMVLMVARIFDLMTVFLFCLAFLPLLKGTLAVSLSTAIAVAAGVVVLCIVALFAMRPGVGVAYRLLKRLTGGAPAENGGFLVRLRERFGRLTAEARMFRDPGHFFSIWALSIAMWTGLYVTFFGVLNGFGYRIDLAGTVLGSLGAVLAGVLPVNGVANLGTLEAGWTLGLVLVGFPEEQAFAAGLWTHAGVLVMAVVLGLLGYASMTLARRRS